MVTSPRIIFIVVSSLAAIVILGLGTMFYLILQKTDAALIGIIASPVATALGSLISLLNNTRTQAAPSSNGSSSPAPIVGAAPTPVIVANTPTAPVAVHEVTTP